MCNLITVTTTAIAAAIICALSAATLATVTAIAPSPSVSPHPPPPNANNFPHKHGVRHTMLPGVGVHCNSHPPRRSQADHISERSAA